MNVEPLDERDDQEEPPPGRWQTLRIQLARLPLCLLDFAFGWWSTRHWRWLLLSLPAVAALLAAAWIVGQHRREPVGERVRAYEAAGMAALTRGDAPAADICFRRLAQLAPDSPTATYGLALAAERQQDLPRARQGMRQIAPQDRAGYPPAHFWLAQDLARQDVPATPRTLAVLEHDLRQAVRSASHQLEARVLLSQLCAAGGRTPEAIQQLEQVVSARPEYQLDLARLYARAGRDLEAAQAAAKAETVDRARLQAAPTQPRHRLRLASAQLLQGRYEDAVQTLTAGLKLSDLRVYHQALAAAYVRWFEDRERADQAITPQQLGCLERALEHDADNARVLAILARLATQDGQAAADATALLKPALAQGAAPAVVHLILGTHCLNQGDLDQGVMHLEQARQLNPRIPTVLNNLAWGLAERGAADLERALELAQAAQRLSPDPEFCDTVGTILIKLGRPKEAVPELEKALRGLSGRAEIHGKLADLYEQLCDSELAALHRRLAESPDAASTAPGPSSRQAADSGGGD